MQVRTRFAPSPTGFLHVGGLRTALFSYLFARKHGGKFLVRIEDTDRERFVEGGIENMIRSLQWAGVTVDEGVTMSDAQVLQIGDKGPYIQSERLEIYHKYIVELLGKGAAYYCFCTKERLDELRKVQELKKQATGYDGHCRTLSEKEVADQLAQNVSHVIRLKMPREGETVFEDMIRDTVKFENKLVDDQVLIKSDGFPTYHFAVVVDDHLMEITHVIRGEEWISSTPKHIMLYQHFGWEAPQFAHLPLLVNEQKQKLSKRHGDVSVEDFKEKGYIPEALVNFVAFLGWNPGGDREIFSLAELEQAFDIAKVSKSPAVFNREKLDWYNKQYMAKMADVELTARALPFFVNEGLVPHDQTADSNLQKIVLLEKERAATLKELANALGFIFADTLEYELELLVWKKSTREDAAKKLDLVATFLKTIPEEQWTAETLEQETMRWVHQREFGVGDVLWPMRVALSGQKNSPGPFEIAAALGKEKALSRLQAAVGVLA